MAGIRVLERPPLGLLPLAAATLFAAPRALAQETAQEPPREPIRAVVDYMAGANLYLRMETASVLRQSDSLTVRRDPEGSVAGAFRVVSTNRERAVVVFAGDPFPLTRGDTLFLSPTRRETLARRPDSLMRTDSGVPATSRSTERRRSARPSGRRPRLTGGLSLDFSGLRTETQGPADGDAVVRSFATPSVGLRARATDLPGGLLIDLYARASYRYSTDSLVRPVTAFRLYRATISKTFRSIPLQFQLGRFYNQFEAFSGTWDGLLVHLGRPARGFGGGVAAGFQPIGTADGITGALPKYSLFLNYSQRSGRTYYATDFSFHQVRPRDGTQAHTFLGWSNRLRVSRFLLSQRIQVDMNPVSKQWTVTNLYASLSAPLGKRLSLNAGYSLRQPYVMGALGAIEDSLEAEEPGGLPELGTPLTEDPISFRRDRFFSGLTYRLQSGSISADFVASRLREGEINYTYSSAFSFPGTPLAGLGFGAGASYWTQGGSTGLVVTPTISRDFGRVHTRAAYQYYSTRNAAEATNAAAITTNAGELSVTFPIASRFRSSIRGRIQRGTRLNSSSLIASFFIAF